MSLALNRWNIYTVKIIIQVMFIFVTVTVNQSVLYAYNDF